MARTVVLILLGALGAILLTLSLGERLLARPALGVQGPSLRMDANKQVKIGHPIEITLVVKDAADVAGYETNLLFDKKAAEFASVIQENKDLGKAGRDVEPLGAVEMPRGVSFGGFSCLVNDCVKLGKGPQAERGVGGTDEVATVNVVPKRPGKLEFELAGTKFVDAAGEPVNVEVRDESFVVRVGRLGANTFHTAPTGVPWELESRSPSRPGALDLTGDRRVAYADAMEAAISWM